MYDSSWSQASMPEESWTSGPSDHSTLPKAASRQWSTYSAAPSCQDSQSLNDASSWAQFGQGAVDMGLSPALSHESQTVHSLTHVPETDFPLLPPGLDLSFIGEPTHWSTSGPVVFTAGPQDMSTASMVSSPASIPAGPQMSAYYPTFSGPQPAIYGPTQTMVHYPEAPAAHFQRRTVSDPSGSPPRRLLPRTDAPVTVTYHSAQQPRPHVSGMVAHGDARVSNSASLAKDFHGHGLPTPPPRPETSSPGMISGPSFVSTHGSEEFGGFVRYEQEQQVPAVQMSFVQPGRPVPAHLPVHHQELTPALSRSDSTHSVPHKATSSTGSVTGEGDEGRHRNHPLYSKGPEADGLYHCPYASDPNCQHKPTKLKCNYDKFIDSHLKPFRCKVESCSKQEFSSTACLLRHEREAHGMHGHGERPHLCFYPGCERGIPGNGFPRRYNLFDHMKRVHDHKEEPQQERAADNGARKPMSRKRKASPSEEPVARRQKMQSISGPPMSMPQEAYPMQIPVYTEQMYPQDQGNMYSMMGRPTWSE
ncbi:hypothetical protein CKM354_000403700 [Cercospora kikuchii]|uniref:C2H2-type domain-containing protein n=1 Tax=Cercospora kikuchii TaxID=84275 RepID=A0A9P3FFD8_9PEZI|nr:uncharacterized protein CKM354_000403700 [Cercospora kikuchii]GIZ40709.1 hypothetical protein CKM354_000403700 [Cercospora kikuchii]